MQVLPRDSAVSGAGCVPQTISHQRESHAVLCVKPQDTEETSAATEVFAVPQNG